MPPVPGDCSTGPPSAVLAGNAEFVLLVPNVPPPKRPAPVVPVVPVPKAVLVPNKFPPVDPLPKAGVVFVVVPPKPPKLLEVPAVDVPPPKIELPAVVVAVPKPDGLAPKRLLDVLVLVLAPKPAIKDGDVSDSKSG